ncbi:MAG: QueT transporter family protein [Oscillospiraceae bacterium]|nr:QueT transporter family protein [Oscillospiraceae bacterium]
MKSMNVRQITLAAVVGALYVTMSYFSNIFGLSYGYIQCRFSEALTVLPFLCPVTAWGLFTGCIVTNLLSPYGLPDLIFGSLATLLAAFLTARCKNKWLAPLPPVVCNGVIIGALLAFQETGFGTAFPAAFAFNAFTVAAGEALACYVLGMLLLEVLVKAKIMPEQLRA